MSSETWKVAHEELLDTKDRLIRVLPGSRAIRTEHVVTATIPLDLSTLTYSLQTGEMRSSILSSCHASARNFGNRVTPHNIGSDQAPVSSTTRKRALPLIMRA